MKKSQCSRARLHCLDDTCQAQNEIQELAPLDLPINRSEYTQLLQEVELDDLNNPSISIVNSN